MTNDELGSSNYR